MTTGYIVSALIGMTTPKFRHSGDKLAYALFAVCYSQGFRLYATGRLAFADDALATVYHKRVDVDGWNEFEDKYGFVFFNPKLESQNKLLLKCYLQNNNNNQISNEAVAASDSSRIVFLTLNVDDFIEQDYDPESMFYFKQFKNLDNLITLINNHILIKLLLNWFPVPTSNITKHHISNMYNFSPKPKDIDISTTTDTMKEKQPQRRSNHYYKCCHQSLGSKFAKMHLADTKKKKKKVNYVSVSKPYKRRSVNNNMKNNCLSGGSKKENGASGVTLYDLPLLLYESMKKAAGIIEHLKTFKDDKEAMEDLERYEFYIANSSAYHRDTNLPTDWTYKRETCLEDISKCYWEKVSNLES